MKVKVKELHYNQRKKKKLKKFNKKNNLISNKVTILS